MIDKCWLSTRSAPEEMSRKDNQGSGSKRGQDKPWDTDRLYWRFVVLQPRHDLTLRGRALRSWRARFIDKSLRGCNGFNSSGLTQGALSYSRRKVEKQIRRRIILVRKMFIRRICVHTYTSVRVSYVSDWFCL